MLSQTGGRLELIVGPMFAGKTTELMRRVKREMHARRRCFIIKYCRDSRYDDESVASHDRALLRAQASVAELSEVGDAWKDYDVIAIDEGQFFPDLVTFCTLAADSGKIVMVSALEGDFLRKPFGSVCELMPLCESIEKLNAVCMMCHARPASFTRRTVADQQQELIGGSDMYIATCRQCYLEPVLPSSQHMRKVFLAIQEVEDAFRVRKEADKTTPTKDAAEEGESSSAGNWTPGTSDCESPLMKKPRSDSIDDNNNEAQRTLTI